MRDNKARSEYLIEKLDKKHKKDDFKCGVDELDYYLKTQAGQDIKKNVAVTYVMTEVNSEAIIGYYTLSSIGIFSGELPEETIRKLPRYPVLPGILLGRLARDEKFKKNGIGIYLLVDALKRSLLLSHQIGIVAVIVDAKSDKAANFYKKFGFNMFPENHNRLFLPMGTIKALNL